MYKMFNLDRRHLKTVLIVFSLILSLSLIVIKSSTKYLDYDTNASDINNVLISSLDGKITLKWTNPKLSNKDSIIIKVSSNNMDKFYNLNYYENSFIFNKGIHGQLYEFDIKILYNNNRYSKGELTKGLFLNYEDLPNLPILKIDTKDNQMPEYTIATPPKGYQLVSITNNEYVPGNLELDYKNGKKVSSQMNIRIRGNASAAVDNEKKPFKIELEQKIDLLARNHDSIKSKDWVLLSAGTNLNNLLGKYIAENSGLYWQPDFEYVNLMINGDWYGTYLLIEAIENNRSKINVENNGFIIENDAYWWNGIEHWFKTNNQHGMFCYTFQFPKNKNLNQEFVKRVKFAMNEIEELIYTNHDSLKNKMDLHSFTAWILTHDILGTWDAGGSNMFLYIKDMSQTDINKLTAGPVWDLDSIMSTNNTWSNIHTSSVYYYDVLFNNDYFIQMYKESWFDMQPTLYDDTMNYLKSFYTLYGDEIQKSWDLDAERWERKIPTIEEQLQSIDSWMSNRIKWINQNIK